MMYKKINRTLTIYKPKDVAKPFEIKWFLKQITIFILTVFGLIVLCIYLSK